MTDKTKTKAQRAKDLSDAISREIMRLNSKLISCHVSETVHRLVREAIDLPDDPPGDAGLLRELDAFAYEMGVLAEADYIREHVNDGNAVDVLGRLRDLMTRYKDDSEELGDVQSWLFERVGHQEDETIFDKLDRLLAAAPADKPDEPAPDATEEVKETSE